MQESYKAGITKSTLQTQWLSKYDTLIIAMIALVVLMAAITYIYGLGTLCICLRPYMKSKKERMSLTPIS